MSQARYVTVFGATGTQGSSVVRSILADKTFTPRAVTRNPSSPAAQALQSAGAELVKADMSDIESLRNALSGSECAFIVTNDDERQYEDGKNMVDACKDAGVKFVVMSSLPSATEISGGRYEDVFTFNDKARVEAHLRASGVPYASIYTAWFADNLWKSGMLQPLNPDSFDMIMPHWDGTKTQTLTFIDRDLGPAVVTVLKNYNTQPDKVLGQTFNVFTDRMPYLKWAELVSKALGKPVNFNTTMEIPDFVPLHPLVHFINEFAPFGEDAIPDPRLLELGMKPYGGLNEEFEQKLRELFA